MIGSRRRITVASLAAVVEQQADRLAVVERRLSAAEDTLGWRDGEPIAVAMTLEDRKAVDDMVCGLITPRPPGPNRV